MWCMKINEKLEDGKLKVIRGLGNYLYFLKIICNNKTEYNFQPRASSFQPSNQSFEADFYHSCPY